jgi:hypothetical protein
MELNIENYQVLIDDADYDKIKPYTWTIISTGDIHHVIGWSKPDHKWIYLENLIINPQQNQVGHINNSGLDNRRDNLRFIQQRQTMRKRYTHNPEYARHKSNYKGVYYHVAAGKWQASKRIKGSLRYIGLFDTPIEAHQAYLAFAEGERS